MARVVTNLRSVRGRITLISTALVAITLIAASIVLMRLVRDDLLASAQDTLDQALEEQAEALSDAIAETPVLFEVPLFDFDDVDIESSAAAISPFIVGEDGLAFGELFFGDEVSVGLVIDPETGELIEIFDTWTGEALDDQDLVDEIESMLFETAEVADRDGTFVVAARPLGEIEESVDAIRDALMVIVPSLIVVFALLIWWLVGRALRPVMSITDQVQAISASSLDRRVPVPETGDEVANLATVMNRMLDRLQRSDERQRQFSADASHELRSPLSAVRAAGEILAGSPPADRTARLADDIVAEADRMEELIADLLELSRLDEAGHTAAMTEVDLTALVTEELTGRQAALVAPPRLPMQGSPRQLRRLITNLVDNAERHGERVVVTLAPARGGAIVATVDDDGPGVPDDAKAKIFERFSRLDDARAREAGGFGLGLALVRAIAEHHGGTVIAEDSPLGGARFRVSLRTGSTAEREPDQPPVLT